jgi:hypothetical protein
LGDAFDGCRAQNHGTSRATKKSSTHNSPHPQKGLGRRKNSSIADVGRPSMTRLLDAKLHVQVESGAVPRSRDHIPVVPLPKVRSCPLTTRKGKDF